jgi:uncharacterized protein
MTDRPTSVTTVAARLAGAARVGARASVVRRVAVALCLFLVIAVVGVLGGVGWIGSERAIHPTQPTYAWSLAGYPALKAVMQQVTFRSSTGIRMAGRFFPGRSRATIILSEGYGDTQDEMVPWANLLHGAGYSVLTYDMRDRGHSGGSAVTLGALEQLDLVSAVSYVAARHDVDKRRIGALGLSLGGATTILAAARDRRIRAVVDDCGFSDAPGVIAASFTHFIGLPAFPFAPITVKIAEWRAGVDINAVRPMDVIGKISPRPVLIIHGLADPLVPPSNSVRNYAAAQQPKEKWWVPRAGHTQSRAVAGAAYTRHVVAFFRRYLGA